MLVKNDWKKIRRSRTQRVSVLVNGGDDGGGDDGGGDGGGGDGGGGDGGGGDGGGGDGGGGDDLQQTLRCSQ
ncbi:MAG TPA: hypothetical protein VH796_10840 [Nitrososphaeraceae archaeon]